MSVPAPPAPEQFAYARTTWIDGTTPVNAANLNNIESELVLLDGRPAVPAVVNGQWLKGSGGALVFAVAMTAVVGGVAWWGAPPRGAAAWRGTWSRRAHCSSRPASSPVSSSRSRSSA